jgi:Family of unknown function (DUF6326)
MTETKFEPSNVNVRIKISALWTSMLFVFAYVDLFSLYRPDFRADLEAGEIGGFTVNQSFLLGTTVYVVIPSLMVLGALILRPRANRIANIALSIVYALTIISGAIGEWTYYVLGSAIEIALLAAIAYHAWTWPRLPGGRPAA